MILAATILLLATEVLAGVVLAFLPWRRVRDWFRGALHRILQAPNHLYITLHERLKNGKHQVVYGIYDTKTSLLVDGESVTADQIDPEIAALHKNRPLVVYNQESQ